MSAKRIYDKLRRAGLTAAGACGLMGNLMAESSLVPNIAQRGMTSLSDEAYTAKFDKSPDSCIRDNVGYGLAQWTYWSRKQALWSFARSRGKSVGDMDMQLDFILRELEEDYPGLLDFLCRTEDMYTAAERVCTEYERPAVNNVDRRYAFAQDFEARFEPGKEPEAFIPPDISILVLQSVLVGNGYNTEITGHSNAHFLKTLREFVTDIGA